MNQGQEELFNVTNLVERKQDLSDGISQQNNNDSEEAVGKDQKKKGIGRWKTDEGECYAKALKSGLQGRDLVKLLTKQLPHRKQSQIRAHHQKMLKKYKTIERILTIYDYPLNNKFKRILLMVTDLQKKIKEYYEKSKKQDKNEEGL